MIASLGMFNDESGYNAENSEQDLQLQAMTITQLASFQQFPPQFAMNNARFDLDEEVDYDNLHLDMDNPLISPNDKHLILVNSGNDSSLREYIETMDRNGGQSSNNNNVTAQLYDKMTEGVDKSTHDEMLSDDVSFAAKVISTEAKQEDHHSNDDQLVLMPPEDEYSLEATKDQMVQDLLELEGIDESDIQMVLAADATGDVQSTVKALDAVADKYNLGDMKDGVNSMQVALDQMAPEAEEAAVALYQIKPPENVASNDPVYSQFKMA